MTTKLTLSYLVRSFGALACFAMLIVGCGDDDDDGGDGQTGGRGGSAGASAGRGGSGGKGGSGGNGGSGGAMGAVACGTKTCQPYSGNVPTGLTAAMPCCGAGDVCGWKQVAGQNNGACQIPPPKDPDCLNSTFGSNGCCATAQGRCGVDAAMFGGGVPEGCFYYFDNPGLRPYAPGPDRTCDGVLIADDPDGGMDADAGS